MLKHISGIIALLLCAISLLQAQSIQSPNGKLRLQFSLSNTGEPQYQLDLGKKAVLKTSKLGIQCKDEASFDKGFAILKVDSTTFDQTWAPVWGESNRIRNHYRELRITLEQKTPASRQMVLCFRLFNDGLGFRYEFPAQANLNYFIVSNEKTEFQLSGDHKAFWIPGDYDTNEYQYNTSALSKVNGMAGGAANEIHARTPIGVNFVQTPLMMKTADGLYLNIHEAALVNYPAMNLEIDQKTFKLSSHLVPDAVGNKAYLQAPFNTPWRTIIVAEKATDILASRLILNLNEPSKIANTSWIKPTKYVGVWWEMHVGKSTWDYAGTQSASTWDLKTATPSGRHGATTQRVKTYIDFAAKHGFDGVLVEGWNTGWEDWFGKWKEDVFDFITPYPDYNVKELRDYAKRKGVKIIMHHETSGSVTNYERWMDKAYDFMKANGYDAVKTGYVGKIIPRGEHHDGQWMVNHYNRVAAKTAAKQIMLDAHEPVRPTGLHRTYPNWLACEATRGNEFNAWSVGNPPEHETILPFTRSLGGPIDYTPGIFQIKLNVFDPNKKEQVHTTLSKQLALYVTLYSPLQMAADLPESYDKHLDAFQFIKDVAVDWDESHYLEAEPGDYLSIARKAKGRNMWFVGAITDENARTATLPLDFLPDNANYIAEIYADAPDAHWEKNPTAYKISRERVTNKSVLKLALAAGGGAAICIRPETSTQKK